MPPPDGLPRGSPLPDGLAGGSPPPDRLPGGSRRGGLCSVTSDADLLVWRSPCCAVLALSEWPEYQWLPREAVALVSLMALRLMDSSAPLVHLSVARALSREHRRSELP